jgi:hypothetical protein
MNKKTANRIARAELEVKLTHEKYLASCVRLNDIIAAEKQAVADNIRKIEEAMRAKIALEADKLKAFAKPEINKAEAIAKDHVRMELGLTPKFNKAS